jgi:hypothetical protein
MRGESLRSRWWREFWTRIRSGTFGLVAGVATLLSGLFGGAMVGVIVFGAMFGVVLFGSLFLAPVYQRDELRAHLQGQEESDARVAAFKAECLGWARNVFKLLEVQEAKEPKEPKVPRGDLVKILSGEKRQPRPGVAERKEKREEIQRETMSLYLQHYRDDGLRLFDALVTGNFIVPNNRSKLEKPADLHDIWIAADSMHTGAERL